MDLSKQLHDALTSTLRAQSLSLHRERHYRDGRWRFGCSANGNYFTIRFDPADCALLVFDRAWPFDSLRWKYSLAATTDLPDATTVALEIISPDAAPRHKPDPDWTPLFPAISDDSFPTLFETRSCLVIHFWAPWNGVDPPAHKALFQARKALAHELACYSCNIDQNTRLPKLMGVTNIPTISVVHDGRPKHTLVGLHSAKRIELDIRHALKFE